MLLKKSQFNGFNDKALLEYYREYRVLERGTKIYSVYSLALHLGDWTVHRASHKKEFGQRPDKMEHKPESYWVENHGIKEPEKLFGNEIIRDIIYDSINSPNGIITIEPVDKLTPEHITDLNKLITNSASAYDVDLFLLYLKDRGYFNLIKKEKDSYSLQIPNGEICNRCTIAHWF